MISQATLLIAKTLGLLFVLLVTAISVSAQPGDTRAPEEIRQHLEKGLEQASEEIRNHPEQYGGYERRARIYTELRGHTNDPAEREFYTEKALTDFARSIELDPDFWPNYRDRAFVRTVTDRLKNFEDIRSDYLTAIRLIKGTRYTDSDYDIQILYNQLADLYMFRGESVVANPKLIAELYLDPSEYSAWDDFDKGIAYAKKGVGVPAHWWNVVAAILRKGDLAFKRRDYERALGAYQSDEELLGKDLALVCEGAHGYDQCERLQRDMLLTFSIRRGRAYLKLGRAEDALRELNVYFEKAYHLECPDIFVLRAQAHWALGNDELAKADEETARKKGSNSCPFDLQK